MRMKHVTIVNVFDSDEHNMRNFRIHWHSSFRLRIQSKVRWKIVDFDGRISAGKREKIRIIEQWPESTINLMSKVKKKKIADYAEQIATFFWFCVERNQLNCESNHLTNVTHLISNSVFWFNQSNWQSKLQRLKKQSLTGNKQANCLSNNIFDWQKTCLEWKKNTEGQRSNGSVHLLFVPTLKQ